MKIPDICPLCTGKIIKKSNGFFNCENHNNDSICRGFAGSNKFYIRVGYYDNTIVFNLDDQNVVFHERGAEKIICNSLCELDLEKWLKLTKNELYKKFHLWILFS